MAKLQKNVEIRLDETNHTASFCSGLVVYDEALIRGRYVARGWNGSGDTGGRGGFDPQSHPTPQSFWLEIDGQLLASHWEWVKAESIESTMGPTGSSRCATPCDRLP